MSSWQKLRTPGIWLSGLATGLLIGIGMMIGAVVATRQSLPDIEAPFRLPTELQADATSGASTFAIATGSLGDKGREREGIVFLDFLTGDLQCAVFYKNGLLGAKFATNVFQDLNIQATKKPHFLMVTGKTTLQGNMGQTTETFLIYVVDSTTGSFAVYMVPYNSSAAANLVPQVGNLVGVLKGRARNLQIGDP